MAKRPDIAEFGTFLDLIARMMARNPRDRRLMLPIWRALQRELKVERDAEAIYFAAQLHLKRRAQTMPHDPSQPNLRRKQASPPKGRA